MQWSEPKHSEAGKERPGFLFKKIVQGNRPWGRNTWAADELTILEFLNFR